MSKEFTPEESKILEPFFTNLDKPVFCLINLPEVVKGAVFSRYSRSAKSLRRTLLEDFIKDKTMGFSEMAGQPNLAGAQLGQAIRKAEDFYDRVLVGYGDDSVAELAGAHVACEGISNLVAKVVEDARLISPLEKSTRYVWFDQKEDGEYLFRQEPVLMASSFRSEYLALMNELFDTYVRLKVPITRLIETRCPLAAFTVRDSQTGRDVRYDEMTDEVKRKQVETAYRASLRAQVCDVLRGLLPASTKTNLGVFADGRSFEALLTRLYSSELAEARALAVTMHEELRKVIPSFVKRAKPSAYLSERQERLRQISGEWGEGVSEDAEANQVRLDRYDSEAEMEILAAILYTVRQESLDHLRDRVRKLNSEQRLELLHRYLGERSNRRDKPGRAFENVYYRFEILADYGIYRDLQRHRMLTQERQDLSALHGYETPPEIIEAGVEADFRGCMKHAAELFLKIYPEHPLEAQYVVPFAYRIRWYMTMNLRELYHFVELRSAKQGHSSYRRVAQQMFQCVRKVHPVLAEGIKFVDLNQYDLGRSDSELKAEAKRARLIDAP